MRYTNISALVLALVLLSLGTAFAADAAAAANATIGKPFAGQELAAKAKVTIVDARAIALKAHPGTITDEELENEGGGSGLRYSFDITGAKGTQEVGVDAMTGKVLENKLEGPNAD